MNQAEPITDALLKVARARQILKEFAGGERAFADGALPFLRLVEVADATDETLINVMVQADYPVPKNLSVVASEVIYHCRSALDQMAVALATLGGVNDSRDVCFPFAGDHVKFCSPETQRKMKGWPQEAIDRVSILSPFDGGDEQLYGLGQIANVDKHRMLIPMALVGGVTGGHMNTNGAMHPRSIGMMVGIRGDLNKGVVFSRHGKGGWFRMEPEEASLVVTINTDFAANVPGFGGNRAGPTMAQTITQVEGILREFGQAHFGLAPNI